MNIHDLKLTEDINVNDYINFRKIVKIHMNHPEWLGDFSKEDIIDGLKSGMKIWIYYLKDEPVCSMMIIPSDKKALKKFELELKPEEVIDYGPEFVNPKYIGNGLQLQMLNELDCYCKNIGYKYAVSTVHPDNIYSINNLIKDNFILKGTKEFKRGIRNIYVKKLG